MEYLTCGLAERLERERARQFQYLCGLFQPAQSWQRVPQQQRIQGIHPEPIHLHYKSSILQS